MKGYVYIISNKAMPGIFKIGFTLKDPVLRAQQLNSTGIPHPFVVEYEILVDEPHDLEQRVHKILQEFNENKEWFRCSFAQAVQVIHTCYQGRIYYEGCFKTEREAEIERARQEKLHKEQQRLEAERKKQEEEELRLEQERLQQEEEERKQAEQQKMWSYELGFSDDSPKRQPRTKAEYEEEMERAWREAEESRRRERIRQEQEFERIKVEQLEQEFEEKKRVIEEKFAQEYRKTQPEQIIITCPNCGKKQCVKNSPHIKAHCPLCLHNFEINFYEQNFDDGQFSYAWPEKENRRYSEKFSKKDYEDDLYRAWREEELRRQWERTTKKSHQGSKTFIGVTKRDLELERAWQEEEDRRQREREIKKLRQSTNVIPEDTKRDLELERAWREEEERRQKEREARKLQQEGKVIIECLECGQKLRVSNASCLRVTCPKCDTTFYWKNE